MDGPKPQTFNKKVKEMNLDSKELHTKSKPITMDLLRKENPKF
jgi:hypothetical protein